MPDVAYNSCVTDSGIGYSNPYMAPKAALYCWRPKRDQGLLDAMDGHPIIDKLHYNDKSMCKFHATECGK
jgi:hypothetical protein